MQAGSMLYTDSASSYRLITGYAHDSVNHTKKEYARGDVHENRAECLFSLLKSYLRVFRGVSKTNLPGYVGFFQFLRNFHPLTAFEQSEMILYAALPFQAATKPDKLSDPGKMRVPCGSGIVITYGGAVAVSFTVVPCSWTATRYDGALVLLSRL
jgi:hypothetical protein